MMGQPRGDRRNERGAHDRGEIVADARTRVPHIRIEQFRQERADRAERDTHQSEANAQEQLHLEEVAMTHKQIREHQCEHHQRDRRKHEHATTADPVRIHAGQHDEQREHADGDHQHEQILTVREAEAATTLGYSLRAPSERPSGERVEQRVSHSDDEGRLDHLTPALTEHLSQRGLDHLVLLLGETEDRSLLHLDAHDKTDDHQHARQQERHAPAPRDHRGVIVEAFEQEVRAVRQEEADRGAQLREGTVQGTLIGGRVFGGHQRGAGPFAAQTDALDEAAQAQQRDRGDAPHVIGRQAADQEGGDTHRQQGHNQRGLAPHAIAEMAENQGADRTSDEGDGEGEQRHQQRDRRVGRVAEEHLREIVRSGGAVCVEVIELDGCADHGSGNDGANRIARHLFHFAGGLL